jgi:hypothetical protein
VVSTPEYCTVLKTLLMVARISMLRVSPSCMVFESDILFEMFPALQSSCAAHCRSNRRKAGVLPGRIGRGVEPLLQRAAAGRDDCPARDSAAAPGRAALTSAQSARNSARASVPVAKVKLPETENPSRMCEPFAVVTQNLSLPKGSS